MPPWSLIITSQSPRAEDSGISVFKDDLVSGGGQRVGNDDCWVGDEVIGNRSCPRVESVPGWGPQNRVCQLIPPGHASCSIEFRACKISQALILPFTFYLDVIPRSNLGRVGIL